MTDGSSGWRPNLGWRGGIAGGLAALVVTVLIIARLGGDDASESASDHGVTAIPHRAGNDSNAGNDSVAGAPQSVPAEALRTVDRFVRAWVRPAPGVSAQQWWQRVAAFAEPSFAEQLKLTDPDRVPARRVESAPVSRSHTRNRVVAQVRTDAGIVVVTCVVLGGDEETGAKAAQVWKVSDIDTDSTSAASAGTTAQG